MNIVFVKRLIMRKTVCFCDICKKEAKEGDLRLFDIEDTRDYEICKSCQYHIIVKVLKSKLINLTPWCKECNCEGKIREVVKYDACGRNEYTTIKCAACAL